MVSASATSPPVVGVLALQGAFHEHLSHLKQLKLPLEPLAVRTEEDLARCAALIIPGGESTSIALVAVRSGLLEPLRAFTRDPTKAVWGTCAGMILLAGEASATKKGGQELLGGVDIRVTRNQFGSQVESFESEIEIPVLPNPSTPFNAFFIRAPILHSFLPPSSPSAAPTEVLARLPHHPVPKEDAPEGDIVALRQGKKMVTSFHPELTQDSRLHAYFVKNLVLGEE